MLSLECNRRAFLRLGAGIAAGSLATQPLNACLSGASALAASSKSPAAVAKKELQPFGIFFANHKQATGLQFWDLGRWKREIADTKRMGAKAIFYQPFQFGQRSRQDFEDMAPHWVLQREISRSIAEAGLEVGIYVALNDVFPETWNDHPGWRATRGEYSGEYFLEEAMVCPSVTEARDAINQLRETLFAGLPRLDYVLTPITDYGGCGCDMCAPYPQTYLRVLEEQAVLARRHHPEVKIIISGINASIADNDMFRNLLGKLAWVNYVWEFPRGSKPVIRAVIPETTMLGGFGRFGPCPILADIKRGYEYDLVHLSGVTQYCEGIHDDVNRFAVLQFAQDPQRSVEDVAQAYAEDWLKLSGRDASLAGQVIAGLGTEIWTGIVRQWIAPEYGAPLAGQVIAGLGTEIWTGAVRQWVAPEYGDDNPHADERVKILLEVRGRSPGLEDNFRYWLLHYRAICESFSVASGPLSLELLSKEADTTREALVRLEPEYGRFLMEHTVWTRPGRAGAVWNWPRSFNAAFKRENSFL